MELIVDFFTKESWSPYLVGVSIGVLSWLSFLISGKPLATSTTFARMGGFIDKFVTGKKTAQQPYYQKIKLAINWQWMLVMGIVAGAFLSAIISNDFQMIWVPTTWAETFGTDSITRVIAALVGGLFLGFGARWSGGCTSGHGISGTLQLAVSSWIAAIFFFIGGIAAAWFIFSVIA